jgi:hypothetical protein
MYVSSPQSSHGHPTIAFKEEHSLQEINVPNQTQHLLEHTTNNSTINPSFFNNQYY